MVLKYNNETSSARGKLQQQQLNVSKIYCISVKRRRLLYFNISVTMSFSFAKISKKAETRLPLIVLNKIPELGKYIKALLGVLGLTH